MATVALTVQAVTSAGVESHSDTASYDAPTSTDGYEFVNDGKTELEIYNNGSSGTLTATVVSPQTCDQGGTHDITVSIPQGDAYRIGPLLPSRFNATSTGKVTVSLDHTDCIARAYKQSN